MNDYMVEPKSRNDLRFLAGILRKHLGLDNELKIPIVELLDIFSEIFDDFSYEIVSDDSLPPEIHAETNIKTGHISIKESVYERACDGEGRDRMTIAHEIGHYFTICFCGFKLQRNFKNEKIPAFKDPEWQAKCFAGEFMMGHNLIANMSLRDIYTSCGVSLDAAKYQYDHR